MAFHVLDPDDYLKAAKSVAEEAWDVTTSVADAGHFIGGILKGISPALSFVPGLGTVFAVGVYAAGAIAAADPITDMVIGTASAAMPPGLPRIAFDGAANVTKDIAEGKNAFSSAVDACRKAAGTAGPQAEAAFDAALNMARGGKVDPRLIAEAKASFAGGGKSAEMAFDAGIAIAEGKTSDQVVLDVARNYIRDAGGPIAAAAFDTGIALGYGKTLQEAGWAGLHTLVRGNNPVEMIMNFVQQVGAAEAAGIAVPIFLQNAAVRDGLNAIKGAAPHLPDFDKVKSIIGPYVKTFQDNLPAIQIPSGELAEKWGIDEAIVRIAQSAVDQATGAIDQAFLDLFKIEDAPGTKERNDALEIQGQVIASDNPRIGMFRTREMFLHTPAWLRGFDIGVATGFGHTQYGPGQDEIRKSIPTEEQYNGFNSGRDLVYTLGSVQMKPTTTQMASASSTRATSKTGMIQMAYGPLAPSYPEYMTLGRVSLVLTEQQRAALEAYAKAGSAIAAANPLVSSVRRLVDDGDYRWGFDIATGGTQGRSIKGPGQDMIREQLGPYVTGGGPLPGSKGSLSAQSGFDAGQALQFGITKAGPAGVNAGSLLVDGLSGSGFTADQKAAVVAMTLNNPSVGAGATKAVEEKTGFFHKLAIFFGLA